MKKHFLALLLAALMLLAVGCKPTTGGPTPTPTPGPTDDYDPSKVSGEITFWTGPHGLRMQV